MNLRLTAIPVGYPFHGPLDFNKAASQELFNYGADCAQKGRLWTTFEQAVTLDVTGFGKHQLPEEHPILNCPLGDPTPPSQSSTKPKG
jgi:hypothetical protein